MVGIKPPALKVHIQGRLYLRGGQVFQHHQRCAGGPPKGKVAQSVQSSLVDQGVVTTQKAPKLPQQQGLQAPSHTYSIHVEYKVATKMFKEVVEETHNQDWMDWLEAASQQDLYIANKYIMNEPTDYSSTRVPSLRTTTNNLPSTADDNPSKATTLAELFFSPLPMFSCIPPNVKYPPPLKGVPFFSRAHIRQVISLLSPYKAPGPDQIPNVVLIK